MLDIPIFDVKDNRLLFYNGTESVVTIPENIAGIEATAFEDTPAVRMITLPEGLTEIGANAFGGTAIEEIHIPKNVSKIPHNPFCGCKKLSKITIDSRNRYFEVIDNCLIRKKDKALISMCVEAKISRSRKVRKIEKLAFCEMDIESITIPKNIREISVSAFCYCKKLREVFFEEGTKILGERLFLCCENLKKVSFPKSLKSVSVEPFRFCENISEILFPNGNERFYVSGGFMINKKMNAVIADIASNTSLPAPPEVFRIGASVFSGRSDLHTFTVPDGYTFIGRDAFYGCKNLSSVKLGNKIEIIGDNAFVNCTSLKSVKLPPSLSYLGEWAFTFTKISEIEIPKKITEIKERTFQKCEFLSKVTLSKNIKQIGTLAFSGCSSLEEIIIPIGCQKIDASAFSWCSNLKRIYIPNTVTEIGEDAFFDCPDAVIIGESGSYAERYATENGIAFEKV